MGEPRESNAHSARYKLLWTVWMAAGGIAATVFTYMATGNWGWAIVALLASGVVLNFIGQLVVQPIVATRTARHHGVGPRASR